MSVKGKGHRTGSRIPPPSGRKPSGQMTGREVESLVDELLAYHRRVAGSFQRREQRQWSLFYLCGQLSTIERKTIEPMILDLRGADPNAVRALNQFLGAGRWEAQMLVRQLQDLVTESLGEPEGVVIVDGSGFPKQGRHSAGVARQYCGSVGKVTNCQEGVFAVYASRRGYTFLDCRLYLPESWFADAARKQWQACGIPEDIAFRTEPELALEMVQGLVKRSVLPFRWVAADEHFGQNPAFLDAISALGKWYFAEMPCDTRVWLRTPAVEPPGPGPLGRPRTKPRVALHAPRPTEVQQLALRLPRWAWTRYFIKEGSKGPMVAEFAFLRVTCVRDQLPGPRVWLVMRRQRGVQPALKFFFSNAPTTVARRDLAQMSAWRWPIETTLEEGKGEVGMDQYETRTWRGWHHHMVQSFMAHLFLMRLRLQFKKKSGANDGPGACPDRQCLVGRRGALGQDPRGGGISTKAKPLGLPFASPENAETPPSALVRPSKA